MPHPVAPQQVGSMPQLSLPGDLQETEAMSYPVAPQEVGAMPQLSLPELQDAQRPLQAALHLVRRSQQHIHVAQPALQLGSVGQAGQRVHLLLEAKLTCHSPASEKAGIQLPPLDENPGITSCPTALMKTS